MRFHRHSLLVVLATASTVAAFCPSKNNCQHGILPLASSASSPSKSLIDFSPGADQDLRMPSTRLDPESTYPNHMPRAGMLARPLSADIELGPEVRTRNQYFARLEEPQTAPKPVGEGPEVRTRSQSNYLGSLQQERGKPDRTTTSGMASFSDQDKIMPMNRQASYGRPMDQITGARTYSPAADAKDVGPEVRTRIQGSYLGSLQQERGKPYRSIGAGLPSYSDQQTRMPASNVDPSFSNSLSLPKAEAFAPPSPESTTSPESTNESDNAEKTAASPSTPSGKAVGRRAIRPDQEVRAPATYIHKESIHAAYWRNRA